VTRSASASRIIVASAMEIAIAASAIVATPMAAPWTCAMRRP